MLPFIIICVTLHMHILMNHCLTMELHWHFYVIHQPFLVAICLQKQWIHIYLCIDRKWTQRPNCTTQFWDIPHYDSNHAQHIYQTPSRFWLLHHKLAPSLRGSTTFVFPPSTRLWSALSSAQRPRCLRQSIKSISVSRHLGEADWQCEWTHLTPLPPPAITSSPCATRLSQ